MFDRSIIFEKIQNARDLGGIVNKNGQTVRSGCLIHSANLSVASKNAVKKLQGNYRLQKIIDLRMDTEQNEQLDIAVLGAVYCHIPVFDEAVAGFPMKRTMIF